MSETNSPNSNPSESDNANPAESPKAKIAIGSQRDVVSAKSLAKPVAVARAESNPVNMQGAFSADDSETNAADAVGSTSAVTSPAAQVELGLGDDIESEIAAALSGISMDNIVSGVDDAGSTELESQSRHKAMVTRIENDNVFFSLKGRYEGVASLRQFKKPPVAGDLVEVIVKSHNEEDGLYEVAVPGAATDSGDWGTLSKGDVVEARVTGSNTGGLEVAINQLRGFIPASQISRARVEQFGDYINQKLTCVVTEINPARKKLVLSHRAILDREYEETRRQMLETLQPGQEFDGLVTRLMDFGAFVDIGGVEGLVHVSKLSWSHIKHPKEVVQVGQKIKVKIDSINGETGKISLTHRDTVEHPWHDIDTRFPVNSVVRGTVTRLAQFGAFVRLDHGIEGLVHISEVAHHRVMSVKNHVKQGDEVEVKILNVDREAQKISLSIKATQAAPEPKKKDKEETATELPAREAVGKKTDQPLKGGTGRRFGGDSFGLNL